MYHLDNIQSKILKHLSLKKERLEKKQLSNLFSFLNIKSLISEGHIKEIYLKNDKAPFFINNEQMEVVKKEFVKKVGLELPLADIFKVEANQDEFLKFKVSNLDDYNKLIDVFIESSDYGADHKEKIKNKQDKKDFKRKEIEKEHEKNRQDKFKEFDKLSSLNKNFDDLRIVSIDLEFFLNKRDKTHKITEVGVSYVSRKHIEEDGNIGQKKINEHFLVDEYYRLKTNNKNQKNFIFGETKVFNLKQIKAYLNFIFTEVDIVLFHETREDLAALKEIGLDLNSPEYKLTVMDTQKISTRYYSKMFGRKSGENKMELEELLKFFDVDYSKGAFHNAGNDAEYTLRLLMKMKEIYDHKNKVENVNSKDPIKDAILLLKNEAKKNGLTIQDLIKKYEDKPKLKMN